MLGEMQNKNSLGIVLVLIAVLLLAVMDAIVKVLLDDGYSVLQVLAVRSWLIVPVMSIWVWRVLPKGALRTGRPVLHFIRVVMGFFAPFFFFSSLETLHLADATVIFYGATFIMTALSVPVLKEHVGVHRWMAVIVGFIGVLIAANPSGDFMQSGALFAILASFAYAAFMLITRWMGPGEGAFKQVFFFHIWIAVVATALSISDFKPMDATDVGLVAVAGTLAVVAHLSLTRAFSMAPVGLVAPFEYSSLVWATLIGFAVWGHIPGTETLVGAVIVVFSGLYLMNREARTKRLETAESINVAANMTEGAPPPVAVPLPASLTTGCTRDDDGKEQGKL